MNRLLLLALSLLLMPAVALGCRSCQGCFDYCGPLPDEPCDFMYRRNSILGGERRPDALAKATEVQTEQPADGEENVPTPAGEPIDEEAPIPMPPEAGLEPEADPYALDDAPQQSDSPGPMQRLMSSRPVLHTVQGPTFGPPER